MGDNRIEIKILTMDSQIRTVRVDKCIPVPALKQQIAQLTGVVPEQQRLICQGKVLKDEHNLSAYNVEDGHKLHLVIKPSPESHQNPATTSSSNVSEQDQGSSNVHIFRRVTVTLTREPPVAPNSLTTLTQTIDRLRREFTDNVETLRTMSHDDNSNTPPQQNTDERLGVPTPEALASVLMNARGILTGEVSECLLKLGRRLERHANVTDETERSWIQDNVLRSGNLLNHLGATILELARTTLATQIGLDPAHGAVDSGPAHFISSTGPRPLTFSTNPNPRPNPNPNLSTFSMDDVESELGPALESLVSGLEQIMNSLSGVGNSQPVDSEPEPELAAVSEDGLFLSNMLQQLMPLISEPDNGPENNSPSGDQESRSRRRDDDDDDDEDPSVQPEAKRQRRD